MKSMNSKGKNKFSLLLFVAKILAVVNITSFANLYVFATNNGDNFNIEQTSSSFAFFSGVFSWANILNENILKISPSLVYLISIILLLSYCIFNLIIRIKAEKDIRITKDSLKKSVMKLEATNQVLLSSEIELNKQLVELQKKEEALRTSRERYRLASKGAEVGIWDWGYNDNDIYLSTKAKELLGLLEHDGEIDLKTILSKVFKYDKEHFISRYKDHYEKRSDIFEVKCRMEIKEKKYSWFSIRGKIEFDEEGNAIRIAGSVNNINKEKLAEAKIEKLAYYDELTQLPNKAYYDKTIKNYHKNNRINRLAILCIDIDNFKCVNDCVGYEQGDIILKNIVKILRETINKEDTLIRFGGDGFIIMTEDFQDAKSLKIYGEKIINKFGNTIEIDGFGFLITLSIGFSIFPIDDSNIKTLLNHGHMALNDAKEKGKNRVEAYSKELNNNILRKRKLESDLRYALNNDELELYYQPKYDLSLDEIVGYEALIRWNHPDEGMIFPNDFIPLAEERGLIVQIGQWVIEKAIKQLGNWNYLGYNDISISINISGKQFKDAGLVNLFKECIKKYNVEASDVEIEITETTALFDMCYAVRILNELRECGFRIALDDFGTGYSSLNYLNSLPIDILKIDKSFIESIIHKKEGEQIIKAVISLAHAYNMQVVAEGVETLEQLEYLREERCDLIQGDYISPPTKKKEAILLIEKIKKCG